MLEIVVAAGVIAAAAGAVFKVASGWRKLQEGAWSAAAQAVNGRFEPRGTAFLRHSPARVVAAMRAAAALAAGGRELLGRWRTLARELGARVVVGERDDAFVPGQVRLELEHEGRAFAIAALADGTVRVRLELGRKDAP